MQVDTLNKIFYYNLGKGLLGKLNDIEVFAQTTKVDRLFRKPFRYGYAIAFKSFIYPFTHKEILKKCKLFNGREINVFLPASTDIFLTGGKSHTSEIRLARFLIHQLKEGGYFLGYWRTLRLFQFISDRFSWF